MELIYYIIILTIILFIVVIIMERKRQKRISKDIKNHLKKEGHKVKIIKK